MLELENYRRLSGVWRVLAILLTIVLLLLVVKQLFGVGPVLLNISYYYAEVAGFVALVFLFYPAFRGALRTKIPWYDIVLFCLCLGVFSYFSIHGYNILTEAWEVKPPLEAAIVGWLGCFLCLEAIRRTQGKIILGLIIFFIIFPVFCGHLPGVLTGQEYSIQATMDYHMMGTNSILGIPFQVFANLVIGFMVFAVALQFFGGGKFFMDTALSLFGRLRGGAAKVSIVASALFGSVSGSVLANVLTTGSMTIPAMKKAGYPNYYAAAVESCSSTGGVLMPPIMGATAFVMASFLSIPYLQVCIAASIPSILYYLGLFMHVDAFAAKNKLSGMARSQLPSFLRSLASGWFLLFSFVALIFFLFYLRREAQGPFYATALLLLLAMTRRESRFSASRFADFIVATGRFLCGLAAILAGIGFMLGSLSMTGVAASFSYELVAISGQNVLLLLALGAFASFILGLGMTVTACYIFLAVTLAPALINIGLNPLAVHLFILYWGMISYITPPVALGSITAASVAGASSWKTGIQSSRLGMIIYFLPFIFVLSPSLIFQGAIQDTVIRFIVIVIATLLISSSMEGYLVGLGEIGLVFRGLFFVSGLLLIYPEWCLNLSGVGVALLVYVLLFFRRRSKQNIKLWRKLI